MMLLRGYPCHAEPQSKIMISNGQGLAALHSRAGGSSPTSRAAALGLNVVPRRSTNSIPVITEKHMTAFRQV